MAAGTDGLAAFLQGHLSLKEFEWEPKLRPCLRSNSFSDSHLIPEIDLQPLFSSPTHHHISDNLNGPLVRSLSNAAATCGFFQVFNHNISLSALETLYSYAQKFFSLPLERKYDIRKSLLARFSAPSGYMCGSPIDSPNKWWTEAIRVASSSQESIQYVAHCFWDEEQDQQAFSAVLEECSIGFNKLAQQLTVLLLQGLGLEGDELVQEYIKRGETAGLKLSHYPACPQPDMTLGIPPHSDVSVLTLLWQDQVGGLQVQRDGTWIAVKPRRDALVVNLGDIFQVWSNNHYLSGLHRVVLNEAESRYSISYFYYSSGDSMLAPLPQLLSKMEEPSRFNRILISDHRSYVYAHIWKRGSEGVEYLRC